MLKTRFLLLPAALLLAVGCASPGESAHDRSLDYPPAYKVGVVDTYFGTAVPDPYRWLEKEDSDSTREWIAAQNELTFGYLENIPFRDSLRQRLEEIWNYPKYSTPFGDNGIYLFYKNDGLQNQRVLYLQQGLDARPEVLIDPNPLSKDGTVALRNVTLSKDGQYLGYGYSEAGSDWKEFHVMHLPTRKTLPDHLKWIKFSGMAWRGDGFYYSAYDAPAEGEAYSGKNEFMKVFFHRVGAPQADDELIYQDERFPERQFWAQTTHDERFLILYVNEKTSKPMLLFQDFAGEAPTDFKTIINTFENEYGVIDNLGDHLLVWTDRQAPNYRLVLIDPYRPEENHWVDFLPEKEDEVLQYGWLAGGKLVVEYLKEVQSRVYVYDLMKQNGALAAVKTDELQFPVPGSVHSIQGNPDDSLLFVAFSSYNYPKTIYQYNVNTGKQTIFRQAEVAFDPEAYVTRQVFYHNRKDSTRIPMFIVHRKGLQRDGTNPAMLYGYGGFGINCTPWFDISSMVFLERGGIFAVPNIRGGAEYGEAWHEAGKLLNKQNVFDDFISAAEYLIAEGYTSPERLAISGRSNGGLLVGAVMNPRPELFRVAVPAVGVMDMLRYHRFTIGWAWAGEYGSSDDSVHFENLYRYSPLHNIREGVCYPATLTTTADHDDRVVPAHSFKFIATLQEHQACSNPVLIRIETRAGHGSGKPTDKTIAEIADMWAFVLAQME